MTDSRIEEMIISSLQESLRAKDEFVRSNISNLIFISEKIASAFSNDRKLIICGNGGSASDAQHLAAEFVNRFKMERPPLPAIAITTDTSILTSIGNDYGFDHVFSKQIKAIGVEGDILLAISTSGRSPNIIRAVESAKEMGIYTIGLSGGDGNILMEKVDLCLCVKSNDTPRIQESHIFAGHVICELVDFILFQRTLPDEES
jgi:D-sedoheptulose 7-phosphate isomerase